ncbi:MAG: universal stress protein [Ilumatobacteraceae bacterium]
MPGKVVVGTDGSEASFEAVKWAAHEALAHDAQLEVIHAWTVPAISDPMAMMPIQLPVEEFIKQAETVSEHALRVARDAGATDVKGVVARGSAAEHLITASKSALVVVVGTRGRGGFIGLLLGSVAQQVATHAACPVVVVPHRK